MRSIRKKKREVRSRINEFHQRTLGHKKLKIKIIDKNSKLPTRVSGHSAGLDVYSCEKKVLKAKSYDTVRTGISIEISPGCVGLIWPRSGLSAQYGIDTLAGVIDSDYRGELKVVLMNNNKRDFQIQKGDRIAQLIVQRYERFEPVIVPLLSPTERGERGFGSSGK
ncbi:MAG: dUTP diphosphatase [Candidatus Hydrogenedentota bacterium]